MMSLIHTRKHVQNTYQLNDKKIMPIMKSTRIQPPAMWGVFFWHRPSAVLVQDPTRTDEIIEIEDPTRKAQLLLLGIGILVSLLISISYKSINERKKAND